MSHVALSACGGGGGGDSEQATDTPPPQQPPSQQPPPAPEPKPEPESPPAPAPSPSDNQAPVANAGDDRTTVEEQDVQIDGSGTRDPDGDALSYSWRLVSAPNGSRVAVVADTASFVFRPDLPGTYRLELTANDGRSSHSDTMQVVAEPLLVFPSGGEMNVEEGGKRGKKDDERRIDLALRTSAHYRGSPVNFTVATDVQWLRPVRSSGTSAAPGSSTSISVELVDSEVEKLQSGRHEARVTVTPAGGWEQAHTTVTLELKRTGRLTAGAYLGYTGEPTQASLYSSEEMLLASTETPLPQPVRSIEYDTARDVFYTVQVADDGRRTAFRWRQAILGGWTSEILPISAPWAVALNADGTELLVSSGGCTVHSFDPETLALLQSLTKASCDPTSERFGALIALMDGRVWVVDDLGESTVWEYPSFAPVEVLPRMQDTHLVLSEERNRLVWAGYTIEDGSPSIQTYELPETSDTFVLLSTESPAVDPQQQSRIEVSFDGSPLFSFIAAGLADAARQ